MHRRGPRLLDTRKWIVAAGVFARVGVRELAPRSYPASPVGTAFLVFDYTHQAAGSTRCLRAKVRMAPAPGGIEIVRSCEDP
jgi:hypothetical protein